MTPFQRNSLFKHFFLILLFTNASFIVMYFLTYYFLYNGHCLVIFAFDNGDMSSPKRHVFISLLVILKCFSKPYIIRSLKRDNGLDLFRRLEKLSIKQINCDGAIEFLRLCQNFGLTPTFAKLDETKTNKWKQPSERFTENVIAEELRAKLQQTASLKKQLSEVYSEIRQKCSFFRYLCILKTIALLRKKHYQKMRY